jgi:hypothetical protein
MPDASEEMDVSIQRRGDGAYIRFIHHDNMANSMEDSPIRIRIEYAEGFTMLEMHEAYTMRMLTNKFRAQAHDWLLNLSPSYRRDTFGAVIHEALLVASLDQITADECILCLPPRIQEDAGRGTEINLKQLQSRWYQELRAMTPLVEQYFAEETIQCVFRMRYQNNTLRVWFAREDTTDSYPLAEAAAPKDR